MKRGKPDKIIVRILIGAIFLAVALADGYSQYGNRIYLTDNEIAAADSQHLFFRFTGSTFFNNKEFFNPYQPGYTLLGYYIRPAVEYYPGPNTMLRAGVHLLKYSGLGSYHQSVPLFTLHHRFSPGLELVAGSLYGSLNHGLIEPLFAFERVFTNHNESGLQVLIDRGFIKADIWLNWEKFIFKGDPFQEEFTAGFSSQIFTGGSDKSFRISFPVQLLATHKGGQIDASAESLQTLVNYAAGVHIDKDMGHSFIKSFGFRGYLAGFSDFSNSYRYPFKNGWGLYPNLYADTKWAEAGIGYWRGNQFIAPRGEPLFQSVSQVDPDFAMSSRELITGKVIVNRSLTTGINMGLRFEFYYDRPGKSFDHTAGLHLMIDERFFITRVHRRQH